MRTESNSQSIEEILERIRDIQIELPRMVIAIDGRGGAGKSTMARAIAARVPGAVHVEYDWFHHLRAEARPEAPFDEDRFRRELLDPFRAGHRSFAFQRYNWGYLAGIPDGFAAEPIQLTDVDVVVVEGCYLLSQTLTSEFDLAIWLDTSAEEALERGVRRDIEEYGLDPSRTRAAWNEWVENERISLAREDRRARAHIVLVTD